jgi:capsular exopolysaccharide synthesis family protein
MNEGPRYVSFRDYLRVARERRVLVVLVTLLFVGCAVAYSIRQDPVYSAEAALEFQSANVESSLIGETSDAGGETPEQRAAANANTITRPEVLERAKKILGGPGGAGALAGVIAARPEARTQLVIVEGLGSTGKAAARVANAAAQAAVEVTREETRDRYEKAADAQRRVLKELPRKRAANFQRIQLQQDIARLDQLARISDPASVRREAGVPSKPIKPKPVRTTLLGLIIGLTLGLVAAFVRDSLDRRFKSSREITEEMHLPLLGHVPEEVLGRALANGAKDRKALSDADLEGFRILRTNIEFLDVDEPPKVVLVTSALPEEGKSTISSGLATAYAAAGKKTLVVECDLRRPTLAGRLGLRTGPGLTDYLAGRATPPEVLQTIALPSQSSNGGGPDDSHPVPLVAIVAGSPAPQPAELLRSKKARAFFDQVREAYDVVIVDSCPLLSVVDTLELLPITDAVVVCVRASKTTRDQARAAKAALAHFPERPTGVVVTGIRARDEAGAYGYYSYGYVYGAKDA